MGENPSPALKTEAGIEGILHSAIRFFGFSTLTV